MFCADITDVCIDMREFSKFYPLYKKENKKNVTNIDKMMQENKEVGNLKQIILFEQFNMVPKTFTNINLASFIFL